MDYQTFNDKLHALGARADCVMCGRNDWHGLGEAAEAEVIALASPLPNGSYDAGHGHGVFGAFCAGCGFVRLHAVRVIAPELAQGPPQNGSPLGSQ